MMDLSATTTTRPDRFTRPSPLGGTWVQVWEAEEIEPGAIGRVTRSERRKLREYAEENGAGYATAKRGRPGWNPRKTFPKGDADKRIPFLVCNGGNRITKFKFVGETHRNGVA